MYRLILIRSRSRYIHEHSTSLPIRHHLTYHGLRRLGQQIQLALLRVITRNNQPRKVPIPRQPARPEALGARARLLRIPQDIDIPIPAVRRSHGLVAAVGVGRERDRDDLVAVGRLAVPGAVQRDVEVLALRVELGVEGRGVRLEGEARRRGELLAGGVVKGAVGGGEELGACLGGAVGEELAAPDGEAGWVAVPVLVGDGRVADWEVLVGRKGERKRRGTYGS